MINGNVKIAIVLFLAVSVFSAMLSSRLAVMEARKDQKILAEIQSLKDEKSPPTPEQMLLLRTINKLENLEKRIDKVAVVAASSNTILRSTKSTASNTPKFTGKKSIAPVVRKPLSASSTPKSVNGKIWSEEAEKNRKKWNAWADRELARLRQNNE